MNFQLVVEVFGFAALLALVVERLVELFVRPIMAYFNAPVWVLAFLALAIGTWVSMSFNVDLFTPLAESVGLRPLSVNAGRVLTGLVIGGGSSFLHDLWPN